MRITIKIDTDNAAFDDPLELSRIFIELSGRTDELMPGRRLAIRDINGNTVGHATCADNGATAAPGANGD